MDSSSTFWQLSESESLKHFKVSQTKGLSEHKILERQKMFGRNTLISKKPISNWSIIVRQLKSIIVLLLFSAAAVSFFLEQWIEGISIIVVLLVNTLIGFVTEFKAIRSMEALKLIGRTKTNVLRNERAVAIDAEDLVPGDIVLLEAGDIVTADIRLLESSKLAADESILTGESVPVEKSIGSITKEVILAERTNMLSKGTALTRGSGVGVVVAIGMQTELGKIAKITQEAHEEVTPLEKRLDKLGQQLVWSSLVIGTFVTISGVLSGKSMLLMFKTAVALSVATIPEGLPIVATMALAKGMWRMAKKNALINRLSAVETLGATSVIFTDKTGTLTENKMTVRSYYVDKGSFEVKRKKGEETSSFMVDGQEIDLNYSESLNKCLEVGSLCNNASFDSKASDFFLGDPMEVALLEVGNTFGISNDNLLKKYPELKEEAFDPSSRMMATYHNDREHIFVAVKGAPESVLKASTFILEDEETVLLDKDKFQLWQRRNQEMANDGLRVLALAYKLVECSEAPPYEDLIFLGLVGIADPARPEIKEVIQQCRLAGIRIVMVTGDQAGTAKKIAKDIQLIQDENCQIIYGDELGERALWDDELKSKLDSTVIFSRVSPQQKLDLIQYYQDQKYIVAMTGDGVNDAPALKKADIGVAMGQRGTQVAKEAADMVLKDDSFNSIISAIQQGRVIFSNIRRFVVYLLSCNISEVLVVSIAAVANAPLSLLPLQILFLNLVTDVFPALALGMGEGDKTYLELPPRETTEAVINKRKWWFIGGYGLIITASVLTAFFYALYRLNAGPESALTVSFLTLGFAQVVHVFNMKLSRSKFFYNEITRNPYIWGAITICTILLLGAVYFPGAGKILSLVQPTSTEWGLIIIFSLIPLIVGQIASLLGIGIKD